MVVLAKASVAILKDFSQLKGSDLAAKIKDLDQNLMQRIVLIQGFEAAELIQEMPPPQREVPTRSFLEKEISTSTYSYMSRGVQTSGQQQLSSFGVQREEVERPGPRSGAPLSPDATMVDFSTFPPMSNSSPVPVTDRLKSEVPSSIQPSNIPSATTVMTSMMRNMADLLECASSGGDVSRKGKERELETPQMARSVTPYDSPVVSALLDEFRSMKEELRRSQQRSQAEIEAIKHEMRLREDKGKNELEMLKRRHREELDAMRHSIRLVERDKDKTVEMEEETRLPALEILDLRRRIASLEGQSRSGVMTPERSASGVSMVSGAGLDVSFIRRSNHPLGHLFDFDDPFSSTLLHPPLTGVGDGPTSAAATPVQATFTGMDVDESIPLPIKSQRKFSAFHRPSLG